MATTAIKGSIVLLGIAIYVMMAVLPFRGLVLCVGAEGSTTVEVASVTGVCHCEDDGGCGPVDKNAAVAVVSSLCCCCVDVPLGFGDSGPQIRPASANPSLSDGDVPLAACDVIELPRLDRTCESAVWHPPRPSSALAHIRSVVLRI